VKLEELAGRILSAYGYNVSFLKSNVILGQKEDESVALFLVLKDADAKEIVRFLEDVKAKRHIAVNLAGAEIPPNPGLSVWGRSRFEQEIGRVTLAAIDGKTLLGEIEAKEDSVPLILEMAAGEQVIKPQFTKERALAVSEWMSGVYKVEMHLIPHYAFFYTCSVVADEENVPVRDISGIITVDAVYGGARRWPSGLETVSDADINGTKLEPQIGEERALKEAYQTIIEAHTEEVEEVHDKGNVTIYEKRHLRPEESSIQITQKQMVYLPAWYIEGSEGRLLLDAVTGQTLMEEVYPA